MNTPNALDNVVKIFRPLVLVYITCFVSQASLFVFKLILLCCSKFFNLLMIVLAVHD